MLMLRKDVQSCDTDVRISLSDSFSMGVSALVGATGITRNMLMNDADQHINFVASLLP